MFWEIFSIVHLLQVYYSEYRQGSLQQFIIDIYSIIIKAFHTLCLVNILLDIKTK